jgi:DNA-binding transcriptional LysR family regulator
VVTVARLGTFTGAARHLYMAQSTLSRQVAAMEREVGGPLFDRGPRTVQLTARGRAFLPAAEEVLAAVERAERAVRSS